MASHRQLKRCHSSFNFKVFEINEPQGLLTMQDPSPEARLPPNLGIQATLSSMGSPAKAAAYGLRRPAHYSRAIVEL